MSAEVVIDVAGLVTRFGKQTIHDGLDLQQQPHLPVASLSLYLGLQDRMLLLSRPHLP